MAVAPVRMREEPLAWVREEMLRDSWRHSVGRREEGRRGGVCVRWAWRRAGGEIKGMAEGGMVEMFAVGVVGGSEGILSFFSSFEAGDKLQASLHVHEAAMC